MSHALVAMQFALIGLIAARLDPAAIGTAFIVLMAAGGGVGAWSLAANRLSNINIRPEPKVGARLVTHGPYRLVRHPMYLAVMLFAAAFAVAGDPAQWLLWVALAAVLYAKALREERGLLLAHPGYADYRARTRAIIPFVL